MDTSGKTLKRMDSSPVKSGIINDTIVSEYFNQKTTPRIKMKIVKRKKTYLQRQQWTIHMTHGQDSSMWYMHTM